MVVDPLQTPLRHLTGDFGEEVGEEPDAEVAFLRVADADAGGGGFFFADDEHVGDALELGVADFGSDFFGAVVQADAQAGGFELGVGFGGEGFALFTDGQNARWIMTGRCFALSAPM